MVCIPFTIFLMADLSTDIQNVFDLHFAEKWESTPTLQNYEISLRVWDVIEEESTFGFLLFSMCLLV